MNDVARYSMAERLGVPPRHPGEAQPPAAHADKSPEGIPMTKLACLAAAAPTTALALSLTGLAPWATQSAAPAEGRAH